MKYYIIAGEASGDLHGSNLIKELKKADPTTEVRCWGGDLMQQTGAVLVRHYKDLAFMGFVEVLANLRTIFRNLDFCKQDILAYRPDALILIDYPGFNMRIAKWARSKGLKIIYYISPQVWAWKEGRVRQIRQDVDKMLVILPFEKDFYKKWQYEVEYVGHPLVEVIDSFKTDAARHHLDLQVSSTASPSSAPPPASATRASAPATGPSAPASAAPSHPDFSSGPSVPASSPAPGITPAPDLKSPATIATRIPGYDAQRSIIALLPGSRKQEILKKLPIMLEVARFFPDHLFVVAKAPGQDDSFYTDLLAGYPNVASVRNQTYALLSSSRAACVTSGTATLETALFGVPEVVCYKGSSISYQIAKRLIKVKYISLVNLIMDRLVVKELIQDDLNPDNLRRELQDLLNNPVRQQQLQTDYAALHDLLSLGGHASANAAASILHFLQGAPQS